MNEIFCEPQVASCQVCVWQLQQFCCQPEVWHGRKVSPRLEKGDWQYKVSAENQMCRSWQEVPAAWAREKGRWMGRGKQKEWARRDKKSDPFARQKKPHNKWISTISSSQGWCTRFMKRNKLVLRQKMKISQRLPDDLDDTGWPAPSSISCNSLSVG